MNEEEEEEDGVTEDGNKNEDKDEEIVSECLELELEQWEEVGISYGSALELEELESGLHHQSTSQ